MTITPEEVEVLKYIGSGLALLLSGVAGGGVVHKRNSKNNRWDEENDVDRRVPDHKHGDNNNGKPKHVKEAECILRHENEKELRANLTKNYEEIKKDIRSINQLLGGG